MINLYKPHSKNPLVNLFTKKILQFSLLLVGILCCNQAYSVVKSNNFKKADAETLIVTLAKTDNPCQGRSVGTITTTVSNGVAPYTYTWNDAVATQDRTNLPAGTYSVTVTDALGDTGTASIELVDPQPIVINGAGFTQITCNGGTGSIFIEATGGTPPYTYTWRRGGVIVSDDQNLIDQGAGTYDIRVTDSNPAGCSANTDFTLVQPPSIVVTQPSHTDNVNFGETNGAIVLEVTGGKPGVDQAPPYTYLWNDGVTTKDRSGLASGTYTVTVTDANNCERVLTARILPLAEFVVSGVAENNKCFGTPNGTITITTEGGISPFKYKWSDQPDPVSNPDRTGLAAGTYTLTAQDNDGNGITKTLEFTITDPAPLSFNTTVTNNVCFADLNGKIDLSVNGGVAPYNYILDGAAPVSFAGTTHTVSNLASGPHTITIVDANNCTVAPPKTVDILPLKAIEFLTPTITNVRCFANSGAIKVFFDGGVPPYKYRWSNDVTLNSDENLNIPVGDYTVIVTDDFGCQFTSPTISVIEASTIITIAEDPALHVDNECFTNPDNTVSRNGSATINIGGGTPNYKQNWTFEGSPINLVDLDPSQNRISVANLASGKYTVMIIDEVGCNSVVLAIDILPLQKISSNPIITNETCFGANDVYIEVNPSGGAPGGYRYTWTGSTFATPKQEAKIGPLEPGTYRLQIFDSRNCPLDTTFVINPTMRITQAEIIQELANVCVPDSANGSARIKVTGGVPPYTAFQFSVINPETNMPTPLAPRPIDPAYPDVATIDKLLPGTYILTVTDQNSCPNEPIQFVIGRNTCDPSNDKIIVDPLMSPNGDGQGNEFFYIKQIEDYPENEVIIYNRWGMEVFTIKGYDNKDRVFMGTANSKLTNRNEVLVDGVYYYTIRSVVDKKQRVNKGYIIIKR